jgi:uncharacterized protein with HEPN domain
MNVPQVAVSSRQSRSARESDYPQSVLEQFPDRPFSQFAQIDQLIIDSYHPLKISIVHESPAQKAK